MTKARFEMKRTEGDHAQKTLQCFYQGGAGVVSDGSYLCRIHMDSVTNDDKAEKTEVGASPSTLLPLVVSGPSPSTCASPLLRAN